MAQGTAPQPGLSAAKPGGPRMSAFGLHPGLRVLNRNGTNESENFHVMSTITDTVRSWNTTQARAARRLGITQPRLNDLMHGKIDKFSLDTLLTLATRAELRVKVDVRAAA